MCCTACCPHFDRLATWCQSKISERCMLIFNILACLMLLTCVAFRFVYMADGTLAFFYIILSVYLVAFTLGLILAEFKVEKVRLYVNFLDTKFGRGIFMIFLSLLILEEHAIEVILFLCIMAIGILNMIVGCKQGSDGKKALKEKEAASAKNNDKQPAGPRSSSKSGLVVQKQETALEKADRIKFDNDQKELEKQSSLSQLQKEFVNGPQNRQPQNNQMRQGNVYDLEEVDRQYYGGGNDSQQVVDNHMIEINLNDDDEEEV
ncbi:UNKNOWN [Stylonychia lemnae]|uniref:COPI associated protein n=1 Tax=Stylonychia lemnae TaxID=5949 RepID=A0A078B5P8_STYLE|nr:UNKNOWN [Stylonychia lemnae]|eukprot:CDW89845.1 UNKNOWN [Stylonychia lemnae]